MAQRQRKGGAPARGGGQGVFYAVLGVIALVGIVAIVFAVRGGAGSGTAATEPVPLQVADARELHQRATPNRIGDDAAPVKIFMFDDLQCPACAAFATTQRPRIMPWVERGHAQIVLYDFPLGGNFVHSFLAARAARCAGDQDQANGDAAYWAYRDRLYRDQRNWSPMRTVTDEFVGYAGELGLDQRAFERCLRSDRFAEEVTANRMLGDQLGVHSTPTVLVNNRRVTGNTIDAVGSEVIRILRETEADAQAPTPTDGD